ncbi:hypothetical protein I5L38_21430 [Serratia marcescens]|uniref:hypothetical protein n=1 Tax=Serratia TaxID=613 RepID=UPI001021D2B6|nr:MULTISPECIES: hypothetical protein [Serratia]MBH2870428.1 hypothetical protein [Serratia marcescens]MBH3131154.1 hypothetical protein [Serratia marcescens]MDI3147911.1 hypothetical protein [Serratia nevei]NRN12646.1 hypothetical protein [Serratia marcescens]NRN36312.1 hypothetical protein [Serratia marcescens]
MIDFKARIVSGVSMGNVAINGNISLYINEMHSRFSVKIKSYFLPDGSERKSYTVDNTLTVVTDKNGVILSLGCNAHYQGSYNGIIFPGMKIIDIIKLTTSQKIYNGSIIINDDFGVSFILPPPYDEIADAINYIPAGVIINEIFISDFSFWR